MAKKLSTPFANNSTLKNDVPVVATTDQTSKGIVGYNNGWTSINKLPLENGGQPPCMEDFNGVLYDVTGNIVDINRGLPQYFDSNYATLIGGYPKGSRLSLDNNSSIVISLIDANNNNPNSNMTGWHVQDRFKSVEEMSTTVGGFATTNSYYDGLNKGAASYYYDASQASVNNGVTIIDGWCLDGYLDLDTINCFVAGFKADGSDETDLAKKVFNDLNLQVEIPLGTVIAIDAQSKLETHWACGEGTIHWLNADVKKDLERIVDSNVFYTPYRHNKSYVSTQMALVQGALGGKNVGRRFQCNTEKPNSYTFNKMETLINYGGADIVGDIVEITDPIATTYDNCTYSATGVQSDSLKNVNTISAGDYIRAGTDYLGVVKDIDVTTGTVTLADGWGNTVTKELNVVPTNTTTVIAPIAYRMWGRNDYVTARANNSTIYNIIGYEMDIIAGHNLTDAIGFFAVAFGTDTCVSAFRSGRGTQKWWHGFHVPSNTADVGVYIEKVNKIAFQHGAQYVQDSVTLYSSQAYVGARITYPRQVGVTVDNAPVAFNATNVNVGLDVNGGSDTGINFNGTNGNAKAVSTQTNSGYLLHSEISGLGTYTVSSTGQANRTRKVVTSINSDTTLSRDNSTNMIVVNGSVANISLSLAFQDGEIIEIKSTLSSDVLVKDQGGTTIATLNTTAKSYGRFLLTNGNWVTLFTT